MEELNLGPPNTNRSSDREEDLNPGLSDYKSSALTTSPCCLQWYISFTAEAQTAPQSHECQAGSEPPGKKFALAQNVVSLE